jgi:DNA-binding phage protein
MKKEANDAEATVTQLIAFWSFYRKTATCNISDLANYTHVSRDTVYRWLNKKAKPKMNKIELIKNWIEKQKADSSGTQIP